MSAREVKFFKVGLKDDCAFYNINFLWISIRFRMPSGWAMIARTLIHPVGPVYIAAVLHSLRDFWHIYLKLWCRLTYSSTFGNASPPPCQIVSNIYMIPHLLLLWRRAKCLDPAKNANCKPFKNVHFTNQSSKLFSVKSGAYPSL